MIGFKSLTAGGAGGWQISVICNLNPVFIVFNNFLTNVVESTGIDLARDVMIFGERELISSVKRN